MILVISILKRIFIMKYVEHIEIMAFSVIAYANVSAFQFRLLFLLFIR